MSLDTLCKDPEFADYGDTLPAFSPFIGGLNAGSDLAAQVTRDLYYHVNPHYPDDGQFSEDCIPFDVCMSYVGHATWNNVRNMTGWNSEEFWESIYTFLSAPQVSARVALGKIVLI
jgi:hypothetical protein